ncbi:MAG TPA: hypothetical protein VFE33_01110 [Thermoanaerobaculia bacterium]|nr:hypothetical protein [Thermoanaerobaculia bacterium]
MKRNALLLTLGVLTGLSAVPGSAQPGRRPELSRTSVIALQVNVGNAGGGGSGRPITYGVQPNSEPVPLAPGQSVQVALVGTAIVNNVGVERPIRARFHLTSGSGGLELGQSGSNWVIVRGRGYRGNGLAQLAYDVTDNAYTMRGAFLSGRVTFQLSGGDTGPGPGDHGPGPGPGGDRYQASERITRTLYRAILRQDDLGRRGQDDAADIERGGYPAIQRVARGLANEAVSSGIYNGRNAPEIVGRLYRELLRRTGGERQLADTDEGFRENVRLLRDRGLTEVVRVVVGSQEFQRVQELDRYGLLYGGRDGDRGGDRGRGGDRDYRRPPGR